MKIACVIPAYNESERIAAVLQPDQMLRGGLRQLVEDVMEGVKVK